MKTALSDNTTYSKRNHSFLSKWQCFLFFCFSPHHCCLNLHQWLIALDKYSRELIGEVLVNHQHHLDFSTGLFLRKKKFTIQLNDNPLSHFIPPRYLLSYYLSRALSIYCSKTFRYNTSKCLQATGSRRKQFFQITKRVHDVLFTFCAYK